MSITYEADCSVCTLPILPGTPVRMYDDIGEVHAICGGADEANNRAGGKITVDADEYTGAGPAFGFVDVYLSEPGRPLSAVEALQLCADTFRLYEGLHLAKATEEATLKAKANAALAAMCDEVISRRLILVHPDYMLTEPHLSGARVVLGYAKMADAANAHAALAKFTSQMVPA